MPLTRSILVGHLNRAPEPEEMNDQTDLANAIFDYIETFCNRQRRHSELDYRTPIAVWAL